MLPHLQRPRRTRRGEHDRAPRLHRPSSADRLRLRRGLPPIERGSGISVARGAGRGHRPMKQTPDTCYFLLEIGCEELPDWMLSPALDHLEKEFLAIARTHRLGSPVL